MDFILRWLEARPACFTHAHPPRPSPCSVRMEYTQTHRAHKPNLSSTRKAHTSIISPQLISPQLSSNPLGLQSHRIGCAYMHVLTSTTRFVLKHAGLRSKVARRGCWSSLRVSTSARNVDLEQEYTISERFYRVNSQIPKRSSSGGTQYTTQTTPNTLHNRDCCGFACTYSRCWYSRPLAAPAALPCNGNDNQKQPLSDPVTPWPSSCVAQGIMCVCV